MTNIELLEQELAKILEQIEINQHKLESLENSENALRLKIIDQRRKTKNFPQTIHIKTYRIEPIDINAIISPKHAFNVRNYISTKNMPFEYGLFLYKDNDAFLYPIDEKFQIIEDLPKYRAKDALTNGGFKFILTPFEKI